MELRSKTKTRTRLIVFLLCAGAAWAQTAAPAGTYAARHRHLRNGGAGTLTLDGTGVSFAEQGKHANHSQSWKYEDIQQLTLGNGTLRILTYEDNRWQLGRDRVYLFDGLPPAAATAWYPALAAQLDQRFVGALAADPPQVDWQIPVKLMRGRGGSQGVLQSAGDRVIYRSSQAGESRTWRLKDLRNVDSSGIFELTITTYEKDFQFQLRQALPQDRFEDLWRRVERVNGLQILNGNAGTGERQ